MTVAAGVGVLGFKGKVYLTVTAALVEIKAVGDFQIPRKATEIETTSRADGGTKSWTKGLKEFGLQFKLQKRKGGTIYEALKTAWRTDGATVVVTACDGDSTVVGTDVLTMECEVFEFSDDQPIDNIMMMNVTLKPSFFAATTPAETTTSA